MHLSYFILYLKNGGDLDLTYFEKYKWQATMLLTGEKVNGVSRVYHLGDGNFAASALPLQSVELAVAA